MVTRKTNDAVVAYRKTLVLGEEHRIQEETLNRMVEGLSGDEFVEYVRLTQEIDRAVDFVEDQDDGWSPSTRKQRFRAALNGAGRDR